MGKPIKDIQEKYSKFLEWDFKISKIIVPKIAWIMLVVGVLSLFVGIMAGDFWGSLGCVVLAGMCWYIIREYR